MDLVAAIAALRAAIALTSTLTDAVGRLNAGEPLTKEQTDAITAARKLAVSNFNDTVNRGVGQ